MASNYSRSKLINTAKLLNENELIEFLTKFLTCGDSDKENILNYIKKLFDKGFNENSQDEMKNYMSWVNNKGHLKVTTGDVPKDILPSGSSYLHDVKIECRGPDDKIFDKDAAIRAKVARGNCILETNNPDKKYDFLVFALRKFTGGLGDEDDVDRGKNEWRKYFLTDIEKTKLIVSTTKANGEAAHLSCRWDNGSFLICSGSKNVHLLFRKRSDITTFYGDGRYKVAKEVSFTICKYLEELDEDTRNTFLSFLSLTRLTVVFEILQPENQHVEDLSYLKEPLLKFITFTQTKVVEEPSSLCYMPPHYCIEIAKLFSLSCVDVKIVPFEETEQYIETIRSDHGYEGVVIYFMDEKMNIIGILKKKTVWYIILRAIREKLRSFLSLKNNLTVKDLEKRIVTRLKDIQTWIGFDDNYFNEWKTIAVEFANWFSRGVNTNREIFYNKYPTLWTKFLKENKLTDKFKMISHENDGIVNTKEKTINVNNFNKLCIPEDYMPEEEEEEDKDGEFENKVEEKDTKPISNIFSSVYIPNQDDEAKVKKIKDQLSNPAEKLSKKEKRTLKKRLKKLLKKDEKSKEDESDDDSDCADAINFLNLN